jgi:hypothetical protein
MKRITIRFIAIIISILSLCCKNNSTGPIQDQSPKFTITADKTNGSAPLKVHFTGTFSGKIDTIMTSVPACIIFPGVGRTIVPYWLSDSVQPAKSVYYDSSSYGIGTYKAMMQLYTRHKTYYSDTLIIIVD